MSTGCGFLSGVDPTAGRPQPAKRRCHRNRRLRSIFLGLAALTMGIAIHAATTPAPALLPINADLSFIDTSIENGSPLHWDVDANGTIRLSFQFDHQRASPNRAAGHWHFRIEGRPGATLTLLFQNFENVWNGRLGSPVDARTACLLSDDDRTWRSVPMELVDKFKVRLKVTLPASGSLYLARVEPYRLSDLDKFIAEIRSHPLVGVAEIGRTVEGRPLEILRIGLESAPHRIFLRARAHPWEPGGNWVVEGYVRALLADTPANRAYLAQVCAYILPMANKDGVARGRTRFNLRGWDLNRDWDKPAPADLAPENHALEQWLTTMASRGLRPDFALDLHNDNGGNLHLSRPAVPTLEAYLADMKRFEALLRQHTWFTEGATGSQFHNPGTLGDGWLERFGIPAAVLEFNAHWIAGKQKAPLGADWMEFGRNLPAVFSSFFNPPAGPR